ncbi:hypothetical protein ACFY4C_09660 [Actinomadura viridis]|uniref:hypothetical protein n=1 Tax=Actinomadura viridis TaxID=58110 RepID=UPI00369AD954
MPTQQHDVLAELFRFSPRLAADLLVDTGVKLPELVRASDISESCTDLKTSEFASDRAVLLEFDEGRLGVVVEIQRAIDPEKHYSWPLYQATLRARQRCPATLLVIAPDPKVAEWCADPIDTGHPDYVLRPVVLKPDQVPVMTDPESVAEDPALGILSAMYHSDGRRGEEVLQASWKATVVLAERNRELARRYYDYVGAVISDAARKFLENKMKTETRYYSEFFRTAEAEGLAKGKAEGKAEGKVELLLRILEARGIELTEEQRERVCGSTDGAWLDELGRRAAVADSAEGLFD